ncbi:MAG: fused MFS/spermidine synthase [Lentilitoribacter sp.]
MIEQKESQYNTIIIRKDNNLVSMTFGHNTRIYTESVKDLTDELALPVTYTRYMTIAMAYPENPEKVVEIGSGGGRTSAYLSQSIKNTNVTTVELDPEVLRLADKYFGLKKSENLDIVEQDGRIYLTRNKEKHDIIIVDAYRGPFVPFHLLTKQFYELSAKRLNEGGVMVQNIEPSTMLFDAAIATISDVFDHVDLFEAHGNIVVIAYNGEKKNIDDILKRAQKLDAEYNLKYPIASYLDERRVVLKELIKGEILTDDFAPVQYLNSIERHNRRLEEISQ